MAHRALGRYLLFQIPGWVAVAGVAWGAWRWLGWPGAVCIGIFAAWLVKDAVMYPFVRRAYEDHASEDARIAVGTRAVATEDLAPEGFVRAGSELWRAELAPGAAPVARGQAVRVCAVRGLCLVVEAEST